MRARRFSGNGRKRGCKQGESERETQEDEEEKEEEEVRREKGREALGGGGATSIAPKLENMRRKTCVRGGGKMRPLGILARKGMNLRTERFDSVPRR
jgi:hypothetical protein